MLYDLLRYCVAELTRFEGVRNHPILNRTQPIDCVGGKE